MEGNVQLRITSSNHIHQVVSKHFPVVVKEQLESALTALAAGA
jgi:hypothetical protein